MYTIESGADPNRATGGSALTYQDPWGNVTVIEPWPPSHELVPAVPYTPPPAPRTWGFWDYLLLGATVLGAVATIKLAVSVPEKKPSLKFGPVEASGRTGLAAFSTLATLYALNLYRNREPAGIASR